MGDILAEQRAERNALVALGLDVVVAVEKLDKTPSVKPEQGIEPVAEASTEDAEAEPEPEKPKRKPTRKSKSDD